MTIDYVVMLEQIAEGLWSAQASAKLGPGISLPCRMVVMNVDDGLLLHSPISIDEELAAAISKLGEVAHIVGPSLMHHLHLRSAVEAFPKAQLWLAPGLAEKRKKLEGGRPLSEMPALESLSVFEVQGQPKLNEVVFLHRPSSALVCSDLFFNIQEPSGWVTGLVLRMSGTNGRLAQSKLWLSWVKDRAAASESIDAILAEDFEMMVPAHGEVVTSGARDALREIRRI